MQMQSLRRRAFALIAGFAVMAFSGWANADPPSRVARLGYTAGAVSFSPAGENDWVQATVNRPLTNGDRLWADAGARAEIQVGGAMIRMNAGTSISVLNLDDQIAQLQLTQGTLNVRVRRLDPNQVFEVDTPNLAFTLRKPGEYRIAVDSDGNATTIIVRKGQGEVYGEGAAFLVDARQPYRFTGTDLRDYQYVAVAPPDEFDRWTSDRDRRYDNSASARYVSPDVVGYQDLDANGTWRADPSYGNVWIPNRVAAGWAPYRDGHWTWVDPWGWTWVDDAAWGFAVSHYGRWMNLRGTWGWVPGPARIRAYYAPALVAFVGGNNFQLAISGGNVGGMAWFPLAPREVYRPSYPVSRGYFENINRSNTVINNTVINNTYNTTNVTNVIYANRGVRGAVVAVPTTVFVQSQPVSRAAVRVSPERLAAAGVANVAAVAPTEKSVRGAAGPGDKPPARVFERPVVARTAPAVAHVGFAAQQPQLTAKPGKPLDDVARKELKPAATVPVPIVKVVTPAQLAPTTMPVPLASPGVKPGAALGKLDAQEAPAATAIVVAPSVPPQKAAQPHVVPHKTAPPISAAQSAEPRGKSDQRGNDEQRARPAAPPQVAPPAAPIQIARPVPDAQQTTKRESTPAPKRAESSVPVAAPKPPPQRPAPQVAPSMMPSPSARQQPAKPEGGPAAKQGESRPSVAAPKPPPPSPQAQAASKAESHVPKPKPAASSSVDIKYGGEESKREEENRKQKR